jgi:hypothetical protein
MRLDGPRNGLDGFRGDKISYSCRVSNQVKVKDYHSARRKPEIRGKGSIVSRESTYRLPCTGCELGLEGNVSISVDVREMGWEG